MGKLSLGWNKIISMHFTPVGKPWQRSHLGCRLGLWFSPLLLGPQSAHLYNGQTGQSSLLLPHGGLVDFRSHGPIWCWNQETLRESQRLAKVRGSAPPPLQDEYVACQGPHMMAADSTPAKQLLEQGADLCSPISRTAVIPLGPHPHGDGEGLLR